MTATWFAPMLGGRHVRLAPLCADHADALRAAAADGALWTLRFTSVPGPDAGEAEAYIAAALAPVSYTHLVPSSEAWTADPLRLRVTEDRAIGLGACDIKGAAAGLIVAAQRTSGDAAFLFTTDEEANDARCIAGFLASEHGFREAIVAEPTRCEAVLAHRSISSVSYTHLDVYKRQT